MGNVLEDIVVKKTAEALTKAFDGPMAEIGHLVSDRIRYARWKSVIRVLEKARIYANERGRELTRPELKFLVPFLESCSLEDEDNEELQSMWANLLVSASTSEVGASLLFNRILKEISSAEAHLLRAMVADYRGTDADFAESYSEATFRVDCLDAPISPVFETGLYANAGEYLSGFVRRFEGAGQLIFHIELCSGKLGRYPYDSIEFGEARKGFREGDVSFDVLKSLGLIERFYDYIDAKREPWLLNLGLYYLTPLGATFFEAVSGPEAQNGRWVGTGSDNA